MFTKLNIIEPFFEITDWHFNKVGNATSINLYPRSLFFKSCAVTGRTNSLTTIAAHHDTVLDFILILLNHLEERVDRNAVGAGRSIFFPFGR